MNKTAQREAILQELRSSDSHPTANELYTVLRIKLPSISLGTVYRNLEQMAQVGMVREIETAGKQKRFDGVVDGHHHIRCPICDALKDAPSALFGKIDREVYEIMCAMECDSFNLEFSGQCRKCKNTKEEDRKCKSKKENF
ncbi:MAG: transcriptional repressor [Victivallales bacterium]|jgi:Fe2+ or Zn2+ uptake regulation protein|nr:transcriptional repressor [Victivallales bacterium]